MDNTGLAFIEGIEDLDEQALAIVGSGFPLAPVFWGIGMYLAKTVGDHWGEFKDGVGDGFGAVWGSR